MEHKDETWKKENSERHDKNAIQVTFQKSDHQKQALSSLVGVVSSENQHGV